MAITRSWTKNPKNFEIISRDEAHRQGRTIYYDGPEKPCKHGHTAPRYVANAGCLACLTRHAVAKARSPISHDLVPYMDGPFWRSKRLTPEQLVQLKKYLQLALDQFCAAVLPPLCKACDGTRYVIVPGASPVRWELCTACAVDEPSTANGGAT